MYALKFSKGYVTIRPADAASCELWLNNERVCECNSADAAAQLVAHKRTGRKDIDFDQEAFPNNIEGWSWISVSRPRPVPRILI